MVSVLLQNIVKNLSLNLLTSSPRGIVEYLGCCPQCVGFSANRAN